MFTIFFTILALTTLARGHVSIWHPSMWGFNVTDHTFPYDNRPVTPLVNYTFDKWWFHGHLDYPPHDGDFFELPAGQIATAELGCNKGATSYFASSEGGDIRKDNCPCPNSPLSAIHTTGPADLTGCSLAITYKSDVTQVQPEDFTVFSVNQTCVWTKDTDFQVPARMPPCPEGGCICAWFWIHSPDSGGEQNYMNGFRCNVTGTTSNVALATPKTPRRCGADKPNQVFKSSPGNCTYGAKQPFYWFQAEKNNMPEGTYSPPFYTDLYNFLDGSQDDIFVDSYTNIPVPSVNQKNVPIPVDGLINGLSSIIAPPASNSQGSDVGVSSTVSVIASSTGTYSTPVSSVPSSRPSSNSVMSSSSLTLGSLVAASSDVTVTSISTVVVMVPAEPSSTPVSSPSIPDVTVTNTLLITVFATEPASTSTPSLADPSPTAVQDEINLAVTNEFVAEAQPFPVSCKARPAKNLRRRSSSKFVSKLLTHRKPKRNYSLWHMF